MDTDSIFIKEEPVWDGEPASDEGPRDVSQHIKTEDTTSIKHGIDELEQSSYLAANNMAHLTAVKKEETEDQDNPGFEFVHTCVDELSSLVSSIASDVDPLQLSSCELPWIKKEELYAVKQEPPEQAETSVEVSDKIHEKPCTDQGIFSSSAGCSFTSQPGTAVKVVEANDRTMLYCCLLLVQTVIRGSLNTQTLQHIRRSTLV